MKVCCTCCGNVLERQPCRVKAQSNFYCSAKCQMKHEYGTGERDKKTIALKAHQVLRERGHYKRDNSYLTERNPGATPEARRKVSEANTGTKNGMFGKVPWNKMFPTKKWYEEKEFNRLRELCLERDGHKCVVCGVYDSKKHLYCDHIIPYRICKEHALQNLQMLCGSCHSKKTVKDTKLMKKSGYL